MEGAKVCNCRRKPKWKAPTSVTVVENQRGWCQKCVTVVENRGARCQSV